MKRKIMIKLILPILFILTVSSMANAQYKGPGPTYKTYTVKEIIDNASYLDRTDAIVKVQGYIIKQINSDKYEFRDQTGTIRVEIDKKRMPNTTFDEKTELILIGEVDKDLFEAVEIEVKKIEFVVPDSKNSD